MKDTIYRQDAIDLVRDICNSVMSECESMYDPEVKDEVYKDIHEVASILKCNKEVRTALRNMPSAEPEKCEDCGNFNKTMLLIPHELIKCKDCYLHGTCKYEQYLGLEGYCSRGEKK